MDTVAVVRITEVMLVSSTVAEPEVLWTAPGVFADDARCYVVVDGVHQAFVSQQAANSGHDPLQDTDGTWWVPDGPTTRWAALDTAVNTYAERADSLEYVIQLPADVRADTLYLSGLTGLNVELEVVDPIEGPMVDESISLTSTAGITDIYKWSFNPIVRLREVLFRDLPRGAGATLTIRVLNPGGVAKLGNISLGFAETLGGTQWGASVGIRDYSLEEENAFGEERTVERGFRKLASLSVIVENRVFAHVVAKLASMRAKPHLYIGDDRYAPLIVLGRYEDFSVEMSMPPDRSLLSLRLKSLVQE